MTYFLRPFRCSCVRVAALAGVAAALALLAARPAAVHAQAQQLTPIFVNSATQSAAQGYLGIDISDLDADKAQTLKLKGPQGAVITLIDHDAPAGQIGLKVGDVVLQMDGQAIENADQLRRMLKVLPAGRKISLQINRDGAMQTVTVELVDRKLMEKKVWNKLGTTAPEVPEMGVLTGDTLPSGFHLPSFGSTLKVGALVEPLTSQMAAYLGVESGLMVKQVARKSEAEAAGLRAFDVILKVGPDAIATSADWDRALRTNQGKPVPVTILRDKKQQTLTLQVDSKRHRQSELQRDDLVAPADRQLLAAMGGQQRAREISAEALAAAEAAQAEEKAMREQMTAPAMSPGLSAQLLQQEKKLRACMKDFQLDPQQMEALERQMVQFRKNPGQFKNNPRQMQEFERRMDDFRQQMEEWSARVEGRFV